MWCWTWKNNYHARWCEFFERTAGSSCGRYEKDINTNFPWGRVTRFPILSLKRLKNQKRNEKENSFCYAFDLVCLFAVFVVLSFFSLWGIGEMVELSASIFFISLGIVFSFCSFPRSWIWNIFVWVKIVYHRAIRAEVLHFLISFVKTS